MSYLYCEKHIYNGYDVPDFKIERGKAYWMHSPIIGVHNQDFLFDNSFIYVNTTVRIAYGKTNTKLPLKKYLKRTFGSYQVELQKRFENFKINTNMGFSSFERFESLVLDIEYTLLSNNLVFVFSAGISEVNIKKMCSYIIELLNCKPNKSIVIINNEIQSRDFSIELIPSPSSS